MSEELQSILLEDLDIEWPGFRIRRLALNQHMPRVEKPSEHAHYYSQLLLYLRGSGIQHCGGETWSVERGSLVGIAPKCPHGFVKACHVRPVCLAIDLDWSRLAESRSPGKLNRRETSRVEGWLYQLSERLKVGNELSVSSAGIILRIMTLFEGRLWEEENSDWGPLATKIRELIEKNGFTDLKPSRIAQELGQSLDHLNSLLREERSPTIGRIIQQLRLSACQGLLRQERFSIGEIGSRVGIDDQNYFSRWFKRQTGQSPGRWREAVQAVESEKSK